jgi:protein ImuA
VRSLRGPGGLPVALSGGRGAPPGAQPGLFADDEPAPLLPQQPPPAAPPSRAALAAPPAPAPGLLLPPAPEALHPALWRAHQLGRPVGAGLPSGFAALDAQLPGGGWPLGTLTELLLPHEGLGELRLLAPALAAVQAQQRCVMCFDPPASPCAWALSALGLDLQRLVLLRARQPLKGPARARLPAPDVLWALEQALKSGHVGAVLAWLPARLPPDALRRLQLAAQAHDGPVFLLRDAALRHQPSAAPLRLALACAGADRLRVALLKRRGPPLAQPLVLALPPVLSGPAAARAQRAVAAPVGATAAASPR